MGSQTILMTILFLGCGSLIFAFTLLGVGFFLAPPLPDDDRRMKKRLQALGIAGFLPFFLICMLSAMNLDYMGRMYLPCSPGDPCSQPVGWIMMIIILALIAISYVLALNGLLLRDQGKGGWAALFLTAAIGLQGVVPFFILLGPASLIMYETFFVQ